MTIKATQYDKTITDTTYGGASIELWDTTNPDFCALKVMENGRCVSKSIVKIDEYNQVCRNNNGDTELLNALLDTFDSDVNFRF